MKFFVLWTVFALLIFGKSSSAQLGFDKRTADEQKVFASLGLAWDRQLEKLGEALSVLKTDEEKVAMMGQMERPFHDYARQMLVLVDENPQSEIRLDVLLYLSKRASPPELSTALKLLLDYAGTEGILPAIANCGRGYIADPGPGEELLLAVQGSNPYPNIRAHATFWLASTYWFRADARGYAEQNPTKPANYRLLTPENRVIFDAKSIEANTAEAKRLFETVVNEAYGVEDVRGRKLGALAGANLREINNAAIEALGERLPAPKLEGLDSDGKFFTLADEQYRGKVIVLTFSGNWCGPCVQMYPHEREMVKTFSGDEFAMLSVNTDRQIQTLKDAISSGDITWRCWWDEKPDGRICTEWDVLAFPTNYVIDHKGMLRFRSVGKVEMKSVVEKLIEERQRDAGK